MEDKPRNQEGKGLPSLPGSPQPEHDSEVRAGGCHGPPVPVEGPRAGSRITPSAGAAEQKPAAAKAKPRAKPVDVSRAGGGAGGCGVAAA